MITGARRPRPRRVVRLALSVASLAVAVGGAAVAPTPRAQAETGVRVWKIHYRAHNGALRNARVVLPAWYGLGNDPPIALVISPHGRGVPPRENVRRWGSFPAEGAFAVVSPAGQGRRLGLYSWG